MICISLCLHFLSVSVFDYHGKWLAFVTLVTSWALWERKNVRSPFLSQDCGNGLEYAVQSRRLERRQHEDSLGCALQSRRRKAAWSLICSLVIVQCIHCIIWVIHGLEELMLASSALLFQNEKLSSCIWT